jgi:Serpin (serine protease inhibitor)
MYGSSGFVVRDRRPVAVTSVRLSNRLTARWAASAAEGQTTAVSGAAVWPLLAYLAAAADGQGRVELETAVGLGGAPAQQAAGELLAVLDRSPAVRSAIRIWTSRRVELSEWWRAIPADAWGRLTGDHATDKAALDAWVRDRTGGLIEHSQGGLDPELEVLLAAAMGVETTWEQPFETTMLMQPKGPWAGRRLAGLQRVRDDLDELTVADTPAGPVTLLAVHGDHDVVVYLALGEEDRPAADVLVAAIDAVGGGDLGLAGSALREDDPAPGVTVGVRDFVPGGPRLYADVPRFSVTANHDLLATGKVLGLSAVTDRSRGHFPLMSSYPLAVGRAGQDITASFSERGFKAAAVTRIEAVAGGVPPLQPRSLFVYFSRPFAFVAALHSSGLVLLAGWVADVEDFPSDRYQMF